MNEVSNTCRAQTIALVDNATKFDHCRYHTLCFEIIALVSSNLMDEIRPKPVSPVSSLLTLGLCCINLHLFLVNCYQNHVVLLCLGLINVFLQDWWSCSPILGPLNAKCALLNQRTQMPQFYFQELSQAP